MLHPDLREHRVDRVGARDRRPGLLSLGHHGRVGGLDVVDEVNAAGEALGEVRGQPMFGLGVDRADVNPLSLRPPSRVGWPSWTAARCFRPGRVRRSGAGNKPLTETHPGIEEALERLVEGGTRGDPQSPLRWTSKSAAKLAEGLRELGHDVAGRTVARLLRRMGYSLQANRKTLEGARHPDRDAQFEHINAAVAAALQAHQR